MTTDLWTLAIASAVLVLATWREWRDTLAREAMDAQLRRDKALARSMDHVMADESGRCHVCGNRAGMLELVKLYDEYTLGCGACANLLKWRNAQEAA